MLIAASVALRGKLDSDILGLSCWWGIRGSGILGGRREVEIGHRNFLWCLKAAAAIGAATAAHWTGHTCRHHRRVVDREFGDGGGISICAGGSSEGIGRCRFWHDIGDSEVGIIHVADIVIDRRAVEKEVHTAW